MFPFSFFHLCVRARIFPLGFLLEKVARLTSSKTKAMNTPLLRVQGPHTFPQRQHLTALLRERVRYEAAWRPRLSWASEGGVAPWGEPPAAAAALTGLSAEDKAFGDEAFNLTLPGCKATALLYSMSLADFHKLFIGRMQGQLKKRQRTRVPCTL